MSDVHLNRAQIHRIVTLAGMGLAPRVIQEHLTAEGWAIERHTIHNVLARARRRGKKVPRFRSPSDPSRAAPLIRFTLDAGNLATLGAAARQRGLSPSILARRLVEAVIADDIVDAVLDDRAEVI